MKKILVLVLFGVALLVAGCVWFASRGGASEADEYTLVSVEFGRAAEVVSATGVVQPRNVFPVGTELGGKVVEVRADFNQEVQEGDLLLRLDDHTQRQHLRQAELAVEAANAGVQQAEAARDAAVVALKREDERPPEVRRQADVDTAEGQAKEAAAAVETARVRVREAEEGRRQAEDACRQTEIRAPVLADWLEGGDTFRDPRGRAGVGTLAADGNSLKDKHTFTILDRKVSLNQVVGPPLSGQLFTLAGDLSRMRVQTQVVEGDVGKITRGMTAEFTITGADDAAVFRGRVEDVYQTPTSDHGAVFYKVVIDAPNERDEATHEWRLRPGLTASVDVLLRAHDATWKLPAAALSFPMDPSLESEAARAKLQRWQAVKDHDSWRPVWVLDRDNKPWPVFVRTGGRNARGEPGVQDAQYTEVLEWDPELRPRPDGDNPATLPRVIIGLPPAKHGGLFSLPKIKL